MRDPLARLPPHASDVRHMPARLRQRERPARDVGGVTRREAAHGSVVAELDPGRPGHVLAARPEDRGREHDRRVRVAASHAVEEAVQRGHEGALVHRPGAHDVDADAQRDHVGGLVGDGVRDERVEHALAAETQAHEVESRLPRGDDGPRARRFRGLHAVADGAAVVDPARQPERIRGPHGLFGRDADEVHEHPRRQPDGHGRRPVPEPAEHDDGRIPGPDRRLLRRVARRRDPADDVDRRRDRRQVHAVDLRDERVARPRQLVEADARAAHPQPHLGRPGREPDPHPGRRRHLRPQELARRREVAPPGLGQPDRSHAARHRHQPEVPVDADGPAVELDDRAVARGRADPAHASPPLACARTKATVRSMTSSRCGSCAQP